MAGIAYPNCSFRHLHKRHACAGRDFAQGCYDCWTQWHPRHSPLGFGEAFRVARNNDARCAGRGFRRAKCADPVVDLTLEGIDLDETVDSQPPKKWPMPLPTARLGISCRSAKGGANGPQFAPLKTQLRISTKAARQNPLWPPVSLVPPRGRVPRRRSFVVAAWWGDLPCRLPNPLGSVCQPAWRSRFCRRPWHWSPCQSRSAALPILEMRWLMNDNYNARPTTIRIPDQI